MTSFLMSAGLLLSAIQFQLDERAVRTASFEGQRPVGSVKGSRPQVEGRMEVLPDGMLRAQLRAPVGSLLTGEAGSDEYLQESLDSFRHPFVELKVVARVAPGKEPQGDDLEIPALAQVTLHGISRRFAIRIRVYPRSGLGTTASGSFPIDLDEFQVARPSFGVLRARHQVQVRFEIQTTEDLAFGLPALSIDALGPRPTAHRGFEEEPGTGEAQLSL